MSSPARLYLRGGIGCLGALATTVAVAIVSFYLIIFAVPGHRLVLPRIAWVVLYGIYALPGAWPLVAAAGGSLALGGFCGFLVYGWLGPAVTSPASAGSAVASYAPNSPAAPATVYVSAAYPETTFTDDQLAAARALLDEGNEYKRRAYAGLFRDRETWQGFLQEFPLFGHMAATYQLKHGTIDPSQPLWLTHGVVAEYVRDEVE